MATKQQLKEKLYHQVSCIDKSKAHRYFEREFIGQNSCAMYIPKFQRNGYVVGYEFVNYTMYLVVQFISVNIAIDYVPLYKLKKQDLENVTLYFNEYIQWKEKKQ